MGFSDAGLLPPDLCDACRGRLDRLRGLLSGEPLDGLLIDNEKDIRYLCGFVGHDSLLLVLPDAAFVISDPRYDEFLDPWRPSGLAEVVIGARHQLEAEVLRICRGRSVGVLGFDPRSMTVAAHGAMADALGEVRLSLAPELVARLRMRKDPLEIARIEQAITWQQDALQAALGQLQLGMSESDFAARLEYEMRRRGAFAPAFDVIVGAGANSSVPHHQTGPTRIARDVLLVDWGALTPDGYRSDLTRTFGIGRMPEPIAAIYPIVLEAQLAAIDACVPGRTCAEVDAVARDIITAAGHGERFGHGLGHGVGLDVHEPPFFSKLLGDVVLEPGMVMTVEPGIYLPGVGGVRIEDDVLITEAGPRVLSNWPKTVESAVIEPVTVGQPLG
ncbi:MAG: M24 family metallopeptidase [Planctomycetota bacterium]|jgi:Xaa-Pro aminopeptidase